MRMTTTMAGLAMLAGCTATVEQSSLLPTMAEPAAATTATTAIPGYTRQDQMLDLPGLGIVHVARLSRAGARATVIYSGGNGSFIATSAERLARIAELTGADVVTFDYAGRGGTTVPKTTDALIAFGPALMTGLRRTGWVTSGPIYSWGFSLGGATASNIARTGGFAGLVLEATAANIDAVVRNAIPAVMKPFVRVKVSDDLKRFDYVGYAVGAQAPILVIAGRGDRTIPIKTTRQFAADLAAAGGKVTFVEVPGDHGEALSSEDARTALRTFVGN